MIVRPVIKNLTAGPLMINLKPPYAMLLREGEIKTCPFPIEEMMKQPGFISAISSEKAEIVGSEFDTSEDLDCLEEHEEMEWEDPLP